jgi:hypothetical protein
LISKIERQRSEIIAQALKKNQQISNDEVNLFQMDEYLFKNDIVFFVDIPGVGGRGN